MRGVMSLLGLLLTGGVAVAATLPPRLVLEVESAIPAGEHAVLDRLAAVREARHPGQSGFRLLDEGPEAFALRARSARLAERGLDVQTFIWRADLSGKYLGYRLLEAADRGVKVRVLVDDMDARHNNAHLAALAAHPNVAVRIFNPFVSRRGMLGLIAEGLLNFERLNHRMHNKTWIADNRLAIVGGRNLGDEYFGASHAVNFIDLDFAMIGPIVRDVSAAFDRYWNSAAAWPIELIDPDAVDLAALQSLRRELDEAAAAIWSAPYAHEVSASEAVQRLLGGQLPMEWSASYRFVVDDPQKMILDPDDPQRSEVRGALLPLVLDMSEELMILSPYFVPGESVATSLTQLAQAGKRIRLLTNSLVASDIAAVYGGFSRYRSALLESGVQIWELKPTMSAAAWPNRRGASGSAVALHTKALLVDRKTVFVGSYNLDPRSVWLNCEQGVLVENEALAKAVADSFVRQIGSQRSWRVTSTGRHSSWSDGAETFSKDPHASAWQRFQAWMVRTLRIEAQL